MLEYARDAQKDDLDRQILSLEHRKKRISTGRICDEDIANRLKEDRKGLIELARRIYTVIVGY